MNPSLPIKKISRALSVARFHSTRANVGMLGRWAPPGPRHRAGRKCSAAVELVRGASERDHHPARDRNPDVALHFAVLAGLVAQLAVEIDLTHTETLSELSARQPRVALELAVDERAHGLGRRADSA